MEEHSQNIKVIFLRLFIPFGLAYFLSILLGSANAIMSPILISEFKLSSSELGFMSSVYLMTFGLIQFPLGVWLDRYGARRTLAPLMLAAVAASIVLGVSQNIWHLIISRALMGIGAGGCLMSAFKAYADWFRAEKLPLVYSIESFAGGLGGMAASKPMSMLFAAADWRFCFFAFAAAELFCAGLVLFLTPKEKNSGIRVSDLSFCKMLLEMVKFFGDKRFWFVAPCVTASEGVLFSCLYLWVSPWLRDVAGMNDAETGVYMLYAFTGAAAGYFLNGVAADWSNKIKWLSWFNIYFYSGLIMTIMLGLIALINARPAAMLWGFVFFLSTMTMISFPIVRKLFKAEEIGRAMSLLNFLIFAVSFVFQWLIGVALDLYPSSGGHFAPAGYRLSMTIMTVINAAAVVQLYLGMKKYKDKL